MPPTFPGRARQPEPRGEEAGPGEVVAAERGLAGGGFLRAREAETGRPFVTRARRAWTDPEVLAADLKRAGIDHLPLSTGESFVHKARHFFQARGLLGRGAR